MNYLSRTLYNKQLLYPWVPFLSCRVGTAGVLQNEILHDYGIAQRAIIPTHLQENESVKQTRILFLFPISTNGNHNIVSKTMPPNGGNEPDAKLAEETYTCVVMV